MKSTLQRAHSVLDLAESEVELFPSFAANPVGHGPDQASAWPPESGDEGWHGMSRLYRSYQLPRRSTHARKTLSILHVRIVSLSNELGPDRSP
jgi:hypothetical protein